MYEEMIDTPEEFKNTITLIQNKCLADYSNFSNYISNLYELIGCGVPYTAEDTRTNFNGMRTWRFTCTFGGRTRLRKKK